MPKAAGHLPRSIPHLLLPPPSPRAPSFPRPLPSSPSPPPPLPLPPLPLPPSPHPTPPLPLFFSARPYRMGVWVCGCGEVWSRSAALTAALTRSLRPSAPAEACIKPLHPTITPRLPASQSQSPAPSPSPRSPPPPPAPAPPPGRPSFLAAPPPAGGGGRGGGGGEGEEEEVHVGAPGRVAERAKVVLHPLLLLLFLLVFLARRAACRPGRRLPALRLCWGQTVRVYFGRCFERRRRRCGVCRTQKRRGGGGRCGKGPALNAELAARRFEGG